jgi:hypothetical protein
MRRGLIAWVIVLSAGLLVSSGSAQVASGLRGHVRKGPVTPVCVAGRPCDAPAVGVVLVFSRNGHEVRRSKTGPRGGYSVRLRPGSYDVRLADPPRIGKGIAPKTAVVRAGRFRRVDFSIDTGIR